MGDIDKIKFIQEYNTSINKLLNVINKEIEKLINSQNTSKLQITIDKCYNIKKDIYYTYKTIPKNYYYHYDDKIPIKYYYSHKI